MNISQKLNRRSITNLYSKTKMSYCRYMLIIEVKNYFKQTRCQNCYSSIFDSTVWKSRNTTHGGWVSGYSPALILNI